MIKQIINVYRTIQGLENNSPLSLNQTADLLKIPRSTFKDAMKTNQFNPELIQKIGAGMRIDPGTLAATESSDKKIRDLALNYAKKGLILATWK